MVRKEGDRLWPESGSFQTSRVPLPHFSIGCGTHESLGHDYYRHFPWRKENTPCEGMTRGAGERWGFQNRGFLRRVPLSATHSNRFFGSVNCSSQCRGLVGLTVHYSIVCMFREPVLCLCEARSSHCMKQTRRNAELFCFFFKPLSKCCCCHWLSIL